MKPKREEQESKMPMKGRTENHEAHVPILQKTRPHVQREELENMTLYKTAKGRTGKHNPI